MKNHRTLGNITLYSIREVANFLNYKTVQDFKDKEYLNGNIKGYNINGNIFFSPQQISDFLTSKES